VLFVVVDERSMLRYIRDKTAAPYFSNLVWFIGGHVLELNDCIKHDTEYVTLSSIFYVDVTGHWFQWYLEAVTLIKGSELCHSVEVISIHNAIAKNAAAIHGCFSLQLKDGEISIVGIIAAARTMF